MFYDSENALEYNYSCTNCHNESYYNHNYTYPDELICILHTDEDITTGIFKIFVYLMYIAVFVAALVGNGLVCAVVHTTPRMKTVTNYFIVNLAVGDILMTLFCVPFSFVSMLLLRYWPFGAFMCKAVNFSQAVSVLVSAYTLLAISIDRYIIIMHPLKPRLGKTAAKLVVFAVWSGAFITAAPIPIVSTLQRPSLWHRACEVDICGEQWASPEKSRQYTYALLVLQFVLPLSALVCTYARIAHTVWGGRPPGEAQDARDTRMQHSKRKMIKMMLTVVTVFTMSWLPLNIFIVLWTVHEDDEEWSMWPGMPYMWFACHWLAMSHSCYNPMIYCYMNVRYRRGFKEILGGLLCLKKKDSNRPYQRSSICEGIPLSDAMNENPRDPDLPNLTRATMSLVLKYLDFKYASRKRRNSEHNFVVQDLFICNKRISQNWLVLMAAGQRVVGAISSADARCLGVLESPTAPKVPPVHYARQNNRLVLLETSQIHQLELPQCVHNSSKDKAV